MTTKTPLDLTLRDYFAAHALMGILANFGEDIIRDINRNSKSSEDVSNSLKVTGELCYTLADFLVKARGK